MSMRSIYRKIAKAHGVSTAEVKRDMQSAIDCAYKTATNHEALLLQKQVNSRGNTPTPQEFICFAAKKVKDKLNTP